MRAAAATTTTAAAAAPLSLSCCWGITTKRVGKYIRERETRLIFIIFLHQLCLAHIQKLRLRSGEETKANEE